MIIVFPLIKYFLFLVEIDIRYLSISSLRSFFLTLNFELKYLISQFGLFFWFSGVPTVTPIGMLPPRNGVYWSTYNLYCPQSIFEFKLIQPSFFFDLSRSIE